MCGSLVALRIAEFDYMRHRDWLTCDQLRICGENVVEFENNVPSKLNYRVWEWHKI